MESKEIKEPSLAKFWHELYIEKESDPSDSRSDATFCADAALDYGTFRNWKVKYRNYIYREVEIRRKNFKNEMRAKMWKSLTKKLDTDTNAIKLLAQLLGDLVEKTEIKTENMQDADKARRIKSLRETNLKKQKDWEASIKATNTPEVPKDDDLS